ncbi:MAG: hypothetical protein LBG26_04450 [Treponema sp.]|jgi:hypothetical protein|nr:hypothetical protein [Treponema sp.]
MPENLGSPGRRHLLFSVPKFLWNRHILKKKFTAKSNKAKKEGGKEALYRNLFAFCFLIDRDSGLPRGHNFFQNLVIPRNMKVNADALGRWCFFVFIT